MSNNKHRGFPVHEYLSTDRSLLMHGCANIKRQLPLPLIKIYNICLTVFFISSNLYPLKISLPLLPLLYIFILIHSHPQHKLAFLSTPTFLFIPFLLLLLRFKTFQAAWLWEGQERRWRCNGSRMMWRGRPRPRRGRWGWWRRWVNWASLGELWLWWRALTIGGVVATILWHGI